jgi:hypothetical protein
MKDYLANVEDAILEAIAVAGNIIKINDLQKSMIILLVVNSLISNIIDSIDANNIDTHIKRIL